MLFLLLSLLMGFSDSSNAQDLADQLGTSSIPDKVQQAKKSVYRILFLPPKNELRTVSLKVYEELEQTFPSTNFVGWWFQQVGNNCRNEKQNQCPVMADLLRNERGGIEIPLGSAFFVGDTQHLFTSAHIWVRFFDEMELLGNSQLSTAERSAKAQSQLDRSVDFLLFDASGKVVFNTYEAGDSASLDSYAVPSLIHLLYPQHIPPGVDDSFEFLVLKLNRKVGQETLNLAKVNAKPANPNGLDMKYGTDLYPLGFAEEQLPPASCSVVSAKLGSVRIEALKRGGYLGEESLRILALIDFSLNKNASFGMSGGPIITADGEVVSIISQSVVVPDGDRPKLDEKGNPVFHRVLQAVPPLWMPGIGLPQKNN